MGKKAISKARELLEKFNIINYPVNVENIASLLEISVVLAEDLPDEVSGVLYTKQKKQNTIIVNAGHHDHRQRFTIAHEIGHYYLDHSNAVHVDDKRVLYRNQKSTETVDPIEVAANNFAAELLMPEDLVRHCLDNDIQNIQSKEEDEIVSELADKFNVSNIAMTIRLKNIGIIQ